MIKETKEEKMKGLIYPIEILKNEIDNLNKHRNLGIENEIDYPYEEQQYHLTKMQTIFQAISILQKKILEESE